MTKITYEVVEHDGGWPTGSMACFRRYSRVTATRAEPQSRQPANKLCREIQRRFPGKIVMAVGMTNCRQATIAPRPM
jgi:hypothetical protein